MKAKDQEYWQNRLEKLKAENLSAREKASALKNTARSLEKSLRNQKALFDALPLAVVLVQGGMIVEINKTALGDMGYARAECLGREFLDFVPAESRAFMEKRHQARLSGKAIPSQYEIGLLTKDGETIGCDVRVKKIRYKGKRAFLVVLTQVEGRKKREKQMIQAGKMETLTTMASGLNRKISNSLRAIHEHIRRLRHLGDLENMDFLEGLEQIEDAASQIFRTSRELESLSKREPDQSNVTVFDLKQVVKDVKASTGAKIKAEAEKKGIKIRLKTYLRSVSPIEGDPGEIGDAVVNTILNAADAMPQGGDIYLSTEENGGYAHIYVQDSGVGIAERVNGRILDPYFTTKGPDGMGLGLSLSYAIVHRHHGDMEVTSKKDLGTTVTIRLPLARIEPDGKRGPLKRKIREARILIISQDHMIGELLAQVLKSKGYKVTRSLSARDGFKQLGRRRYHLVIADMEDTGIDRKILLENIAKRDSDIPVALIQSKRERKRSVPSKSSPVSLILSKPIHMDKVARQISEVLTARAEESSPETWT